LLYRSILNDGTPNGSIRTEISLETAVSSCRF